MHWIMTRGCRESQSVGLRDQVSTTLMSVPARAHAITHQLLRTAEVRAPEHLLPAAHFAQLRRMDPPVLGTLPASAPAETHRARCTDMHHARLLFKCSMLYALGILLL